jgi:RNA 3'-phosphate cyclase
MTAISIDGAHGEGGGQIIRSTVALSALKMKNVTIRNIRAGRSKPGLKNQHIAGIELVGKLVDAEIEGLEIGSTQLIFSPKARKGGHFIHDIGTAGAISLVLQAVLPAAVLAPSPIKLKITGGTDVSWSPPIDYMREVFVPTLEKLGLVIKINQVKRVHYPRGGGLVECMIGNVKGIDSIRALQFGNLKRIRGISHCVRLPSHVAARQAKSARDELSEISDDIDITEESYSKKGDPHLGAGSGIVLWAESDTGFRIGADALGERGKPAEVVGKEAAKQLKKELSASRPIDSHLSDMLVPFLSLAEGESMIGVTEITSHLTTNLWVIEQILGVETQVKGKIGTPGVVSIKGIGLATG